MEHNEEEIMSWTVELLPHKKYGLFCQQVKKTHGDLENLVCIIPRYPEVASLLAIQMSSTASNGTLFYEIPSRENVIALAALLRKSCNIISIPVQEIVPGHDVLKRNHTWDIEISHTQDRKCCDPAPSIHGFPFKATCDGRTLELVVDEGSIVVTTTHWEVYSFVYQALCKVANITEKELEAVSLQA